MNEFILHREFPSAQELLTHLLRDDAYVPSSIFGAASKGTNFFIFRGQADRSWPLLSTVHRSGNPLERFTPQVPGEEPSSHSDPSRRRYLGWHLHAELRASHLFLEHADKLGLQTPIDYTTVSANYELVTAALNGREYDYREEFPRSDFLSGLALAQHHGVPTRLLDWTESPLVAAYFAAFGASSFSESPTNPSARIAVFALHVMHFKTDAPVRVVQAPRHLNSFLRAQHGLFTYVPQANAYFLEHGRWPTTDDALVESGAGRGALRCLSLPSSEADELLRLLRNLGITRHSLMPSLENAARAFDYDRVLFSTVPPQR